MTNRKSRTETVTIASTESPTAAAPKEKPRNAKTPKTVSRTRSAKTMTTALTADEKETPMTTQTKSPATASASTPAPAASPTTPQPSPGPAPVFLSPPPADAKIPTPPAGAALPAGVSYRGTLPRKLELASLPGAVEDLKRFASFVQVFGVTGLPYAQVLQAFDVGNQWSSMRTASTAWDKYAQTQEALAWVTLRSMMDRLGPLFGIAAASDPSLAVTFPSLAALLGAKKTIAQKAVTATRLNRVAKAKGEPATHGAAAKRRQRAAEKALAAKGAAASSTTVASSAPSPSSPPPPLAAPQTTPAQATANGAAH